MYPLLTQYIPVLSISTYLMPIVYVPGMVPDTYQVSKQ